MTVNFARPTIVDKTRKHFVATALNIWGDREVTWTDGTTMREKDLARALDVQFTPTILIFDESAKVAGFRLAPETLITARSSGGNEPTSLAG